MTQKHFPRSLLAALLFSTPALGQSYLDSIGYTALQARLGAATPNGAGVRVMQVEALEGTNYAPDQNVAAGRPGFTLTLQSGPSGVSNHATGVAGVFFGNGGMATGVTQVDSYSADQWITSGFLGTGPQLPQITNIPKVSNHSYVSSQDNSSTAASSRDILLRSDYLVDRGDHIMVVGVGNNALPDTNSPPAFLFGSGFNSIAVGRTDGGHFGGLTSPDVAGGRVKPDIVAPSDSVSDATPIVSAAAVLLVQAAGTTPFAAKPQTIKAVLLAGATKAEFATAAGGPWTHSQTQPLDVRFGAGQVNINNSYTILTAGRQPANNAATIAPTGWDFNSVHASGGPTTRTYFFDLPAEGAGKTLSAALTWNRVVNDSLVAAPLANLDLKLYSVTTGFTLGTVVDQSISTVDNVEHLWLLNGLPAGRYAWNVELNGTGDADFAVAWQAQFVPVPEPGMLLSVVAVALAVGRVLRKRLI